MTNDVLVVMEQRGADWHPLSLEALEAGKQIAAASGGACSALVLGAGVDGLAGSLQGRGLAAVHVAEDALLASYTADAYTEAVKQAVEAIGPSYVVFPHTYQVRDYAPKVATRCGEGMLTDVVAVEAGPSFVRQLYGGKLNAQYAVKAAVTFVSVQAGAFKVAGKAAGGGESPVVPVGLTLRAEMIRTRPGEAFREAAQTVDLSAAAVIVSVGRGIGEQENLAIVEELAAALGAELGASRPICDAGWLPMERQVGSSGQTVAPKLYLAVGISGAIQHLVGMKGAKTVIAINKDADAPIFEVADVGVVGDLFEVVPALTKALKG